MVRGGSLGYVFLLSYRRRNRNWTLCFGRSFNERYSMDRTRENNSENTMAEAARNVTEATVSAAERVGESLEQGREALAEMHAIVTERTRECVHSTDLYVRDNPWQAVGIAAG